MAKARKYDAKIEFRERSEKKKVLQGMADKRGLELPDIMREAVNQYLERLKKKQSAA